VGLRRFSFLAVPDLCFSIPCYASGTFLLLTSHNFIQGARLISYRHAPRAVSYRYDPRLDSYLRLPNVFVLCPTYMDGLQLSNRAAMLSHYNKYNRHE